MVVQGMTFYQIEFPEDVYRRIKGTISQVEDLNDTLVRYLQEAALGDRYEREADDRGRVRLPKSEYANENVTVIVIGDDLDRELVDNEKEIEVGDGDD